MSFGLEEFSEIEANMTSPLSLAYIGDAVYEVYVRSHVMKKANMPVNKLHRESTHYVSAPAQSKAAECIMDKLSDEEIAIYKRGRNAHSYTSAKNADIVDYRHATGFEALIGYLFLKRDYDRLGQVICMAIEACEMQPE